MYAKSAHAYEDLGEKKEYVDKRLKKGSNTCLQRYADQILDTMEQNSKLEKMNFMKIKASNHLDLKAKTHRHSNPHL